LGYSDHKAQILHLNIDTLIRGHKQSQNNAIYCKSIEEFKCLLNKESWQEVFKTSEANATLQVCMDTFVTILI